MNLVSMLNMSNSYSNSHQWQNHQSQICVQLVVTCEEQNVWTPQIIRSQEGAARTTDSIWIRRWHKQWRWVCLKNGLSMCCQRILSLLVLGCHHASSSANCWTEQCTLPFFWSFNQALLFPSWRGTVIHPFVAVPDFHDCVICCLNILPDVNFLLLLVIFCVTSCVLVSFTWPCSVWLPRVS